MASIFQKYLSDCHTPRHPVPTTSPPKSNNPAKSVDFPFEFPVLEETPAGGNLVEDDTRRRPCEAKRDKKTEEESSCEAASCTALAPLRVI
jgi:hypothetical protein